MEPRKKITSFTDLIAWREAHALALAIYKRLEAFPRQESFVLADQMRRCVISITSNIAEGFSRRTAKDKTQFYYIALGSVTEIQNQLLLARDLQYIQSKDFEALAGKTVLVHKLIFGLIKSVRA